MNTAPRPVAQAFATQSDACAALGSPFMGRLMRLCAEKSWPAGPITDRIFSWQGALGPRDQSVPLRLAGALHALHLSDHPILSAVYPPRDTDDGPLWTAVCDTLIRDAAFIDTFLDSPPQTNEVRRSAVLIAVGQLLADRYGLPMRTSELGASAGLNLNWDRYALDIGNSFGPADPVLTLSPDWTGPMPPATRPDVTARAGVDINPLTPADPTDALRLQSYLWPDQPDRLALTRAAIAAADTPVARNDAIDWLVTRLPHQTGTLHLIYSTIAWQYFPTARQTKGTTLIAAAGATATADTPLAWFAMENDGGTHGAALTLRLWPGDITLHLGRADFHGRWVAWTGA